MTSSHEQQFPCCPSPEAALETAYGAVLEAADTLRVALGAVEHAADLDAPRLDCPMCGPVTPALRWHTWPAGVADLAADCPICGRWMRWVQQVEPWITLVERQEREGAA